MLQSHPKLATATATALWAILTVSWSHLPAAILAADKAAIFYLLCIAGTSGGAAIAATATAVQAWIMKGIE